jgi:hypothetical protein
MIKRIVSAKPKNENIIDARQWSQEINEYVNRKYPRLAQEAYFERFGDVYRIHFFSQAETLADLEKILAEIQTDKEYGAIFMRGQKLFVDGSSKVTILESF